MRIININDKLREIGFDPSSIILGHFDYIGEYTAKRQRDISDPNFRFGAFYRANYERGVLIYHLIRAFDIQTVLEIGHGRGYSTFCAAKAFYDSGIRGTITTVDPTFDENYLNALTKVFPKEWFDMIKFVKGPSRDVVPQLEGNFDFVYIDGDHSYEATKTDWTNCKAKDPKIVLFDDYHLSTKNDPGIQCARAIDEIDWKTLGFDEPACIRMDRRMFLDDRQFTDEQIDYGQVLMMKSGLTNADW